MKASDRLVGVAIVPVRDRQRPVAEARRAKELGYRAIMLPCTAPDDARYNSDEYEPLWSAAEEMGLTLQRVAFSANIKERRDFSCALFDPAGNLLAQAAHIPVHLGSMPASVAAVLGRLGELAAQGRAFPRLSLIPRRGIPSALAQRFILL